MTAEARKIKSDFLLESLSPKEIEQFDKYIKSKFDKSGGGILKFWKSTLNKLQNKSSNPRNDASDDFSRKTISDFVKILESFIARKGYEMDSLSQKVYLAKELRNRNVDKYFTSLIDDVCSDKLHKYIKGYSYMLNLQRLYVEEYFLCNSRNEEDGMHDISVKILKNAEVVLINSKLFEFINRKLYAPDVNLPKEEILSVEEAGRIVEKNASCYSVNYPNVYLDYLFYKMIKKPDEDVTRDGLIETPKRVRKSWDRLYGGYKQKPEDVLKTTFENEEKYSQMVVLKDIEFYSMCEHHMLPFFGKVKIAYIPNGRIVGISKLARLVEVYARRMQVQERLTNQIAKAIQKHLKPKGVGVVIEAKHLCMVARGVEKQNSSMVTSCLLGEMLTKEKVRQEFLSL